jgi:crotonobetainyl-CoA:carnitine CoA-transferase CaiB-like acyl-CoA transferase
MRSVRPVRVLPTGDRVLFLPRVLHFSQAEYVQNMYRSRLQSEVEASPSHSTRNRLLAASLSELLESRKTVKSQTELQALAERYDIDVTKLTELARFINTPSIDESTIVKTMSQDGEEMVTMMVSLCSYVGRLSAGE